MKTAALSASLMNFMGEDLDVANIARVSFDKQSDLTPEGDLTAGDQKLIGYLAEHNHWSPFSHCFAQFRIKAPIFVARQLQKHTVGLAWNEVSRRYVDFEPEFFMPEGLRSRPASIKQGSSPEAISGPRADYINYFLSSTVAASLAAYKELLAEGVCPEQARMVLTQNAMTEWVWSGSLYAFARVCKLRLDPHTQAETRVVAQQIASQLETLFPYSWKALMKA